MKTLLRIASGSAFVAALIVTGVILGYAFDIKMFRSWVPHFTDMSLPAAGSAYMISLSLWALANAMKYCPLCKPK